MAIKKIATIDSVGVRNLVPVETFAAKLASDDVIADRFKKVTSMLREAQANSKNGQKIAPKVDDFLYAHCVMMHAAESALINQDTGEPVKNAHGAPAQGRFENVKDSRGRDSVKWISPDGIRPVKNANGDIFPEEDLIAKHKEWVGKPLCRDHVSNTVDGVRGIVVDTYYDPKFKRVHALFALDKKNYPDLARKVEAGYATSVSMGTAVGRAICTECSNVATVEAEYCNCAKSKSAYGEVNKDLSPIELSIVVTGADPRAKIKVVLASMHNYIDRKEQQFAKLAEDMKLHPNQALKADLDTIGNDLNSVKQDAEKLDHSDLSSLDDQTLEDLAKQMRRLNIEGHQGFVDELIERASKARPVSKDKAAKLLALLDVGDAERIGKVEALLKNVEPVRQPGSEDVKREPATDTAGYAPNIISGDRGQDDLSTGDMLPQDNKQGGPIAAFMSFYRDDLQKNSASQAKPGHKSVDETGKSKNSNKVARNEASATIKEQPMPTNFSELKERSLRRRTAYHQGTAPAEKYAPMGDADKIRNTQDKQMAGDELNTSVDNPDEKVKELHQRASLDERRLRRAALVEKAKTAATGEVKTYKQDGKDVKTVVGPDGKEKALAQAAEDGKSEKKTEKKAYWQGTEEPAPGKLKYAPMGDSDKIRNTLDKQMSGVGMEPGDDGLHPGGGSGKSDEAVKKYWQRLAALKAKRSLGTNIKQAKWDIFADGKKVLTVKASDVYAGELGNKIAEANVDQTYGEYFTSEEYGQRLLGLVREAAGPEGAAEALALPPAADAGAPPAAPAAEAPKAGNELEAARDKVLEALSSIEDAVEDVRSTLGVDGLKDVSVDMAPEAEAGAAPAAGPEALASASTDLIQVFAAMTDVAAELTVLEGALDDGNSDAMAVVAEALSDVDTLVNTAHEQIEIFAAKKGKGKKDEKAKDDKAKAKKDEKEDKSKAKGKADKSDKDDAKKDKKGDKDADEKAAKPKTKKSDSELLQEMIQARAARREKLVAQATGDFDDGLADTSADDELKKLLEELEAEDVGTLHGEDTLVDETPVEEGAAYDMAVSDSGMAALDKDDKEEVEEIADEEAAEAVEKHEEDPVMHSHDESKEKLAARKAWRETVAAKAVADLNKTYSDARKGSGETVKLDANVSGDLALVENLATQQAKDMDVATSGPRNVRMAAEMLNGLITKGAFAASDLDDLVAKGAVDAEAAKYWKQFYGQVDGGKEFAAGLVKEYKQAKQASVAADDTEVREVRMRRAYALGLEAQDRGIITKSRSELEKYVDSMMRLPDEHFEHMKNVVAQHRPAKTATASVQVGVNYDNDTQSDATLVRNGGSASFDELARLFG